MKFLSLVVVVGLMLSQAASFRTRPPSALDWNVDSEGGPDVDIDFEEESSDEEDLKLDWHNSAPVIYRSPSRVVYAHHTSQADPLEDASDENYDIGEHAPGPPVHRTPNAYVSNDFESGEEDEEDSNEESKLPQYLSTQVPSQLYTSSPEYIPPPIVYSPPIPMPSAYMHPKPVPVVTAGSFSEYPVSSINKNINKPINRPRSLSFDYNKPAPVPLAYNPPTPSPIDFNGPNSNAAIYSKPPTARVVYQYALPSPVVNKAEESFPQHKEQSYYYDDDNTPEPMIYDSSEFSIVIDDESKFAPYMYSDSISPSNAFSDSFSSQPPQKYTSFNHITPGFAKPAKDHSFLNLYAKPKQYNIEPFPISSFTDSIPKINGKPSLISKVYKDSKENSKTYEDLKDTNNFIDIEYEDVDHDIIDIIPITYNEPKSQQSIDNLKEIPPTDTSTMQIISSKETEDFADIEYDDVDHDILDIIPIAYNDPKSQQSIDNLKEIQVKDKSTIQVISLKDTENFDDIEYDDVDHDILDSIPVVLSDPKSKISNNVPKNIEVKEKLTTSNISNGYELQSKSLGDTVRKSFVIKTEMTTITPKPIIPAKSHISNQNIKYDTTIGASRMTKMPAKIVNQVKTPLPLTNRLSRFSSRRASHRSPNFSRRMSSFRNSLRESQRQRYRAVSSEEIQRKRYRAVSSEETQRQRYRAVSSEEKSTNVNSFRNRLRYTTRGSPMNNMRRPRGRIYNRQSLENYSSEERISTRRRSSWGRQRQYRLNQSSEEDDDDHDDDDDDHDDHDDDDDDMRRTRTRVSSRLNTRRPPVKTTTVKPTTTTAKSRQISSRGRSIHSNRNRNRIPGRQSLQCFLMSIVRTNYSC